MVRRRCLRKKDSAPTAELNGQQSLMKPEHFDTASGWPAVSDIVDKACMAERYELCEIAWLILEYGKALATRLQVASLLCSGPIETDQPTLHILNP